MRRPQSFETFETTPFIEIDLCCTIILLRLGLTITMFPITVLSIGSHVQFRNHVPYFSCVLATVGYKAVKPKFKLKWSLDERASLFAYSYFKFAQHTTAPLRGLVMNHLIE